MTLREKIEDIIMDHCPAAQRDGGEPDKAAMAILEYLDNQIGLEGNGWFDDDEVMLDHLNR